MAANKCRFCNIRPVSRNDADARMLELCGLCSTEADWENLHSDDSHGVDPDNETFEGCWICFPELNQASENYVPRIGTSRQGMKMNTTRSQSAISKAEVVAAAARARGFSTMVDSADSGAYVVVTGLPENGIIKLQWDAAGRYQYDASAYGTSTKQSRKVRNVSAALSIIAAQ